MSERRIVNDDVVVRYAILAEVLKQREFIVRPDPVAQIIQQLDHRQSLIGRPFGVDEQFKAALEAGGWVVAFHGIAFVLRFLDLAAARSSASLRR